MIKVEVGMANVSHRVEAPVFRHRPPAEAFKNVNI
jgi:hypothetical protein